MIGRVAEIGIILLLVVWATGIAVSAGETGPVATVTPSEAVTPSEIVITDDVEAYYGPLGPDSPLFGLKLALENLDEAFTLDPSERVMKQMKHAELRIAEIKGLLFMNRTVEAERALDGYFEKLNLIHLDISSLPVRTTGIANAYRQHVKHELVLWDLLQKNPDSAKLRQAYNHTLDLEETFIEKSTIRIEKSIEQLNRVTARIVRIPDRTQGQDENEESTTETSAPITSNQGKGKEKQEGRVTGAASVTATPTATPAPEDESNTNTDKGKGKDGKGPK